MARITEKEAGHKNVLAFLDTIAFTEGTDDNLQPTKDDGYDVIVGGQLFTDYQDHPNILVKLNKNLSSTAAGRYQILSRYWKYYAVLLGLGDFSPINQDRYAIQQLKEQKALPLIKAGKFEEAVKAVNDIWASLPGSPYGQHTYPMSVAKAIYVMKGGTYA